MTQSVGVELDRPVSVDEVMKALKDAGIDSLEELVSALSEASQEITPDDVATSYVAKVWRLSQ